MSGEWVDVHHVLPLVGQRYEFRRFDGKSWVGKLVDARRSRKGVIVITVDVAKSIDTALPLYWRPAQT